MSFRPALAKILVAWFAACAVPALAQDPFMYRECMARCQSFKGRTCCHESCSYEACIADKIRTNFGHGEVRGGDAARGNSHRFDQNDPGAWSAAMAACSTISSDPRPNGQGFGRAPQGSVPGP